MSESVNNANELPRYIAREELLKNPNSYSTAVVNSRAELFDNSVNLQPFTDNNEVVQQTLHAVVELGADDGIRQVAVARGDNGKWYMHGLTDGKLSGGVKGSQSVFEIKAAGYTLGRSANTEGTTLLEDGSMLIDAKDVWRHGAQYGDTVSSSHVSFRLNRQGLVEVTDRSSTNGTKFYTPDVPGESKGIQSTKPEEKTAPRVRAGQLAGTVATAFAAESAPTAPGSIIDRVPGFSRDRMTIQESTPVETENIQTFEAESTPVAEWLQPIKKPTDSEADGLTKDKLLDMLWGETDQKVVESIQVQLARVEASAKPKYEDYVNDGTKNVAAQYLGRVLSRDSGLNAVLQDAIGNAGNVQIATVVDLVREDPSVRARVGQYLRGKLENLITNSPDQFGNRVVANSQKKPDQAPFLSNALRSRDYATYLALSMIDGSFYGLAGAKDDVSTYGPDGRVVLGQHRDAANTLLNS